MEEMMPVSPFWVEKELDEPEGDFADAWYSIAANPLPTWLDAVPLSSSSADDFDATSVEAGPGTEEIDASNSLANATSLEVESLPLKLRQKSRLSFVDFKIRLAEVENIADLRKLQYSIGTTPSFSLPKPYSQVAFLHLLELEGSFTELLAFLNDATLNRAEVDNFKSLVTAWKAEAVCAEDYRSMVAAYSSRIAEGALHLTAAEAFVQYLPKLSLDAKDFAEHDYILDGYSSIWDALKCRLATGSDDSQPSIYARLLSHIVEMPAEPRSLRLAADVLLSNTSLHHMEFNTDLKRTLRRYTSLLIQQISTRLDEGIKPTHETIDIQPEISSVLNALPNAFARSWIESVSRALTDQSFRDSLHDKQWRQLLDAWLSALRNCSHLQHSQDDPTWAIVYDGLAKAVKSKELVSHFAGLKSFQPVPFILLRHWLNRNLSLSTPRTNLASPSQQVTNLYYAPNQRFTKRPYKGGQIFRKSRVCTQRSTPLKKIETDFIIRYDHHMVKQRFAQRAAMLALLDSLAKFPREQRDCLELFIELVLHRKPRQTFEEFMELARWLKKLPVHPQIMARYIRYVSKMSSQAMLYLLDLYKRQWTSPFPHLLLKLSSHRDEVDGSCVFRLLRRWDPASSVPLAHRPLDAKNCALSKGRVRTVHDLALAFARSERFSPRQAFRHVWRLYRYLRRARATLSRDISRAMVHAAVIRPMQAGQRVDNNTFCFVIGIVRRLEGSEVADELDMLVWKHRPVGFNRGERLQ